MTTGDFYEDDEPLADILAAWNHLPKNMTTGPFTIEVEVDTVTAAPGDTE